jgi:hypothetical protein
MFAQERVVMTSEAHGLPTTIGAEIDVSTHDAALRRWVEWHGFTMVGCSGLNYRMRRNAPVGMRYLDGLLSVICEPLRPINAERFIQTVL